MDSIIGKYMWALDRDIQMWSGNMLINFCMGTSGKVFDYFLLICHDF